MGTENLNPLDELKSLDQQVEQVTDLNALKPIFARIDELAKQYSDDFEVQLVAGDVKGHLVNRGTKLKAQQAAGPPPTVKLTPGTPPPMPPVSPSAPTVKLTPGGPPPMPPPGPPAPTGPAPTVKLSPAATPPPPLPPPSAPPVPPPTVKLSPAAASSVPPSVPPVKPPDAKPPEVQPPVKLMSSGQFTPPKPAAGPPVVPPPQEAKSPSTPQPAAPPPTAPRTATTQSGQTPVAQEPHTTGQQPPVAAPPKQPPPPTGPPSPPVNWRRPLILGAILGAVVSVALIAILVNQARKHNLNKEKEIANSVDVEMATTPPNASIRVNGETKCNSPCKVPLAPGTYQVMAFLDGYDPATSSVNVAIGQPAAMNLTLAAQSQTVRILTDLDAGKIAFDDQPPADLQEGQFILDKVAPGPHTVKITGKSNTDAAFTFEIAEAKPPAVTGTVTTHNLVAVIVSSFGGQAHVVTNSGPMKLAVNGQPEGDAGPSGVDLKAFNPGVDELIVGEGKDARNMKETFGPQPMLTAFLKSDLNIGTLIVSTGEDDVRVFINNKEYRRRTQRGQLRIPAIGAVSVRVTKDGFDGGPVQTAEVKKGAEMRLEFKLNALPQTSSLQISGGTPGAEVLIDQKSVGTIGPDGNLAHNGVAPGDHTIDIRRDQFTPKRIQRSFKAGQAVAIAAGEATLAAAAVANGTVRIARTPADVRVTFRRADETQPREATGNQVELPPGSYVFYGAAPGYTTRTERVLLGAGETRTVELALARAAAPAPAPKPGDITGFEDAGAWKKEGELWTHRGGGFIPYGMGPKGIYTFTVELIRGGNLFKGGRIRWAVQYVDAKNYLLYEMDRKNLWAEVVEKGKKLERAKTQHDLEKQKAFTIQVEVTPEHVVHRIKNAAGEWVTLDSFAEPGRDFTTGKFGFLVQGNDEIGITDFNFQPK